jgi:pilus assembly protein CpaE
MSNPSCIFYASSNGALRRHALRLEAEGTIELAHVTAEPSELLAAVGAQSPDLVIADLGDEAESVLDVLDKLPTPRPRLIAIGPKDQSGTILRAMRMGVRDYLDPNPTEEDLRSAVLRVAAELGPRGTAPTDKGPAHPARVVAVMGAKGGVGATVVACQLAASLRARGSRTALVDLNLPLGDAALYFDVQPAYTLANIARESDRLDATYLRTLLSGRQGGVQILASPMHAEEAELVRGSHVERALNLLRGEFDWVVLDLSRTWSEPTVRALDLADLILLVTLMDVPTLHHTRKHIDLLERLGHSGSRIRLIANRHSSVDAITDKDVAEFLERKPDFQIPNDFPTTLAAVNRGVSVAEVAPRSALARAYNDLVQALHGWFGARTPSAAETGTGALARVRGMFRRT